MGTACCVVLLSFVLGAVARDQFLLLRRKRDDTGTATSQHQGAEPTPVVHVKEGAVASFTCAAASHGPMSVEWRHNGSLVGQRGSSGPSPSVWHKPLHSAASGVTLTRSRLRLENVSAEHAGEYACHFSDDQGSLMRKAHLAVHPNPPAVGDETTAPCDPKSMCSNASCPCEQESCSRCPNGTFSLSGPSGNPSTRTHSQLANILAWTSGAVAVLLAAFAILAARRIRRMTGGPILLENSLDYDEECPEQAASSGGSSTPMTSPVRGELA